MTSSTLAFVAGVAVALLGACLGILVYARTTIGGHLLATASAGSRVRLHSSLGVYLTVSASDGAVRLGGNNSGPEAWLLVPVAPSMVALLSAREAELQLEADGTRPSMVTRSGCHCNGFSNAYGFGGHCAAWEEEYEAPWCYVDDDCAAVANKGSFGLKHQRCDAEVTGEGGMYQDDLGGSTPYAPLAGWRAPDGCACSGYSNKHGYGASCKAWEDAIAPGQTPWCYTHANCSSVLVRKGSFGHRHVDCEPWYEPLPPAASPPKPPPPPRSHPSSS